MYLKAFSDKQVYTLFHTLNFTIRKYQEDVKSFPEADNILSSVP